MTDSKKIVGDITEEALEDVSANNEQQTVETSDEEAAKESVESVAVEKVLESETEEEDETQAGETKAETSVEEVIEEGVESDGVETDLKTEAAVEDEVQATEATEETSEEIKALTAVIDAHFTALRNLLKYNKEKDANLAKLTAELQEYRDGFQQKKFKTIALTLIGLREDYRKTVREFTARKLTKAEAEKYIKFMRYDYDDMFSQLNIEINGDEVFYNGRSTKSELSPIQVCQAEEYVLPEPPQLQANKKEDVIAYVQAIEAYVVDVLKTNAMLDKLLKTYIENATLYEQGVQQIILYPVINKIAKSYKEVEEIVSDHIAMLTEENGNEIYEAAVVKLIELLERMLLECGVTTEWFVSEVYDPKKQRILKLIPTENEEENGKVSMIYTECYIFEGKVLSPQKVDVLKCKK